MSAHRQARRARSRSRGWIAVLAALLAVAVIGFGGSRLPVQTRDASVGSVSSSLGRTGSVCPSGSGSASGSGSGSGSASPSPSASASGRKAAELSTEVTAVAASRQPAVGGTLTGQVLGSPDDDVLSLTTPGTARVLRDPAGPVLLNAQGGMSAASAGAVATRADDGPSRGLQLSPCVVPSVDQWLVGLGARPDLRDEVLLVNPDSTDAEVDLRLYGENGLVAAAGSSGITVPADSSRTVATDALTDVTGPLAVEVRASVGRVGAVAHEFRSNDSAPAGADLHPASAAPARQVLIPGIPGGAGPRQLSVVNPGQQRATVAVTVLGPQGAFAPAGAASLTVPPQSTAQVDLAAGLGGQIGSVRLTSDQPVAASVTSIATRSGAADDIAISPAQPALGRTSIAPAAVVADSDSQVAISNAGRDDVVVSLQVLDLSGVSIYREDIPIQPDSTAARKLSQPAPAYLVLTVPDGSQVYAGATLSSNQSAVAGVASMGLVTPDPNARPRRVISDPAVGR